MRTIKLKGVGHGALANGLVDVVDNAVRVCEPHGHRSHTFDNPKWAGRSLAGWRAVREAFNSPWAEGLATITEMQREIMVDVPEPVDRRRRLRFNELDGQVDVDRVLARDPAFFSNARRVSVSTPQTVHLLCNIGGSCAVKHHDMFWRGAAAAAVIDKLESAGYSCQVTLWHRSTESYRGNEQEWFTTCPVKEAGDPLDLEALACGLSAWFFRICIMGLQHVIDRTVRHHYGYQQEFAGPWADQLDTESMKTVQFPVVYSREAAIGAARQVLSQFQQEV